MWNLCTSSNICTQYEKQREDQRLRKTIHSIKPAIDVASPRFPLKKQATTRLKPYHMREVDLQNEVLVHKMLSIDSRPPPISPSHVLSKAYSLGLLKTRSRSKQLYTVAEENKRMNKRLKSVSSVYSAAQWQESRRYNSYIRENISRNSGRFDTKYLLFTPTNSLSSRKGII